MLSAVIGFILNNKNLSLALIVILTLTVLCTYSYYKGYDNAKTKVEKEVSDRYIELIKKKEEENRIKFAEESELYLSSIKKQNDLVTKLEQDKNKLKLQLKSKSLNDKNCDLEKEDVSKINEFILKELK